MAFLRNPSKLFVSLLLWTFLSTVCTDNPLSSYEVVFGWKEIDYQFPSLEHRDRLVANKEFIRQNNVITGIKVHGDRVFLTVPRWREGVPSTLNYVNLNTSSAENKLSPLLIPYPSWEMQQLGNCDSLQYIQSMEIDHFNRMWVVDVGRVNIFTNPDNKCPPKLLLIDLDTNQVVHRFEFPSSVVAHTSNFLNDIVVGCTEKTKCWAYITDANDAKLVVYNLEENRSWFVHHKTMAADPGAVTVKILDGNYTFNTNIDGIALSPKDSNFDRVYYCPLSSFHLYSVPTSVLHDAVNGVGLKDSDVVSHGRTSSQSDGLAMDSQGLLFSGLLTNNSVVYVNTTQGRMDNEVLLVSNDVDLQWPDTFGFDDKGYLYMVTNRIQRFKMNSYDFTEVNFRVARVFIGSRSYMYSKSEAVNTPELEKIAREEDSTGNPTNLDKNAPDKPVLVGLDKDSEKYKHENNPQKVEDDEADEEAKDKTQLGGDGQDRDLGRHSGHPHGHDHGQSRSHENNNNSLDNETNSAPVVNEHVPVVIFLTLLMFNPALNP